MGLIEDFDRSGNFLFKHRSYFPLVLYAMAIPALFFDHYEFLSFHFIPWSYACLSVSMLGLVVRAITIGQVPKGTSGRNTKEGQVADTLNTKGIYSIVRHPLYLGNFLMWLGIILYTALPWFIILAVAFFWIYYERIMFAEEQYIRNKFGKDFEEWSAKTPAFFPAFGKYKKSDLAFSLKNVLKREYNGFFATIVSFVLLNFLKNLFYEEKLWLDIEWQITGIAGFIIFITLRTLKKHSRALHVEGR